MNSKPRTRAQELYDQLRNLPQSNREAFLHRYRRDEPSVVDEVTQLLSSSSKAGYESGDAETEVTSDREPTYEHAFVPGEILAGRFRILSFITSGGMGEVYAAEDLELSGSVAIKTIRHDIASDPKVVERFREEISISRRITHPNVCRVFDVATHRSGSTQVVFLTMELLEGESMTSWIDREGAIPTKEAGPIVLQILEGLAAAHRAGVVHQDFKPGNVFLVPEGHSRRAVVMDFGLALPLIRSSQAHGAASPEYFGGTPAYMAPEVLKGESASVASDIYSVGLVLFELVTGRKAFDPNVSDYVALLQLREQPPSPKRYVPQLDKHWERTIVTCLAFDPTKRPGSVEAVIEALGFNATRPIVQPPGRARIWKQMATAIGFVLAIFAIYSVSNPPGEIIQNLMRLTSETDLSSDPSLSRDGKVIAYTSDRGETGNQDIWIQNLPNGEPKRITRNPAQEYETDLSPDASQVAFRSDRDLGGIYVANVNSGQERLLAPYGRNPRFSPDGKTIAFWSGDYENSAPSGRIYTVPAIGGPPQQLAPEFADARQPLWSSDGRSILFTGCRTFSGSLDSCEEWWVKQLDSGELTDTGVLAKLRSSGIKPYLDPGGWYRDGILFPAFDGTETNLWRVKLSPRTLLMAGKAQRLISIGVRTVNPTQADNGTVAFGQLSGAIHIWQVPLGRNQSGEARKLTNGPDIDTSPSISREGHLVAFVRGRKPRNIWLKDLVSGSESLLVRSNGDSLRPLISPSGTQIAYVSHGSTGDTIHIVRLGGESKQLCSGCENPTGWLHGDQELLIADGKSGQIVAINVPDGTRRTVLFRPGLALGDATWSGEAQHLLFTATHHDGRQQIFALKFPAASAVDKGRWIPITGANEWCDKPQWSSDGRVIYYISKRDDFMCIWGQRFSAKRGRILGPPFAVMHFHNPRWTPDLLFRSDLALSISGSSIALDIGEASETIWLGTLGTKSFFNRY